MSSTELLPDDKAARTSMRLGVSVPLDEVAAPGAYVCGWSGHLLRVTAPDVGPARVASFNLVGAQPLLVTKISDDPLIPIPQARRLAQGLALFANF